MSAKPASLIKPHTVQSDWWDRPLWRIKESNVTLCITIDASVAFINVFNRVAEESYSNADPDRFASKEDFDEAVAKAISEALDVLGVSEPDDETRGEFLAQIYSLLDEQGIAQWPDEGASSDEVEEP